jgi:hypothetical protein
MGRRHRAFWTERVRAGRLDDDVDKLPGQGGSLCDAFILVEGRDGALDHAGKVKREPVRCLRFM